MWLQEPKGTQKNVERDQWLSSKRPNDILGSPQMICTERMYGQQAWQVDDYFPPQSHHPAQGPHTPTSQTAGIQKHGPPNLAHFPSLLDRKREREKREGWL
jgi:hypothetical protein